MAEFIEILSPKALADLDKLNSMLVETVSSVDKVSQKFKNITTPSGVDSGLKGLTAEYAKQEKLIADLQIKLQRLAQAQQQTITATNRAEASTMRLNKQKEAQVKALEREQAKLEASANLYNKVQAKMNALSNEYKALATRKELFNNLTAKEEQRYTSLQARIQKYDQTLKAVDASMGKYQRNVGNYASAFNPLSNSINQLTREAPAFANSVQTGFMAISNNLPIFFDAISQTRDEIKRLRADGQQVPGLFKQLASSVLSWGTALSVGVTALTIFGPILIESIFNSKKKKEALEAEKKALEEKTEAEIRAQDTQAQYASDEIARSKILLETAKNVSLSYKQRTEAVKELQERYPDYLGNLSKEKILAGETADAEFKLNDALMKRAMFLAIQDKIIEKTKELVNAELDYTKTNKNLVDVNNLYDESLQKQVVTKQKYRLINEQDLTTTKGLEAVIKNGDKTLANSTITYQKKTLEIRKQLDVLYSMLKNYSKFNNVVVENTDKTNKNNKSKREEQEIIELTKKKYDSLLGRLEEAKSKFKEQQEATSRNTEEWAYYEKAIKDVDLAIEILKNGFPSLRESAQGAIKDFEDQTKATEKQREALEKLNQIMKEYVTGFSADFFNSSGFPTLFKALNGEILGFGENWKVTFQAIGEIAQETFSFVSQLSQQRFQQEYENLQREKEIAIAFAGDSATSREEIELQYQERQREIKRREFKAKQQEAMFNIAIDTAQAIVGAIAKSPLTGGMPWTAIIATLGAIQLGVVASQQIPQFWKGTDNAPEGWAWTQERGREIITDKHGRVKSTGSDGGAKLTYLNKGDKVFDATKSALMFDSALNSMLMDRGVSMPKVEVNNGLNEAHVNRIVKAVQSIDLVNLNIDKGGLNAYVGNGHSRKELANMRVRGRGRSV